MTHFTRWTPVDTVLLLMVATSSLSPTRIRPSMSERIFLKLLPIAPLSTPRSQAPSESELPIGCSRWGIRVRKRLNKLLRSAKSYRTKAAGAVQTRSPLDGRSYSRHVLIEGVRSTSRSKSKKRSTMRSAQSTSRFDPSPMQSNYIRVGDQPGSSSSLMFLSNTTPEYYESVRNPKSQSPDFARYQHGQHYVFQTQERQTLSPS